MNWAAFLGILGIMLLVFGLFSWMIASDSNNVHVQRIAITVMLVGILSLALAGGIGL